MSNTPPFDLVAIHGLAPGWEDQWWVLYELLESRMHDVIMSGPRNDPDHWTVAGPFKSILRDANTAQDFMAELLLGMHRRASAGTLIKDEHLGLPAGELIHRLVATIFLKQRAIDHASRMRRVGVMNISQGVSVGSISVGEEGEDLELIDESTSGTGHDQPPGLVDQLMEGGQVLELEIGEQDRIGAVEETAAIQTLPRLVPGLPVHVRLTNEIKGKLKDGLEGLAVSHQAAEIRLQGDRARLEQAVLDHPGMTRKTLADYQRKGIKVMNRILFEPLDGEGLQDLLGLSSVNAGDQRNTKYRRQRERLFPALYAEMAERESER